MGLIKGGIAIVTGTVLLLSLILLNLFLVLTLSLSYTNVQPHLKSVINDSLDKLNINSNIEKGYFAMTVYCQNNSEYVFKDEQTNLVFVIPCSTVIEGKEKVIDFAVDSILDQSYYKNYQCSFFSCFQQKDPSFLISKFAQDYWRTKFYSVLIFSFILLIILFLFIDKKLNIFTTTGILVILSSIPFIKTNLISSFLNSFFLLFIGNDSNNPIINSLMKIIFSIFLSKSSFVFKIIFSIGLFLLITGIILKLFNFEKRFFSKNESEKIKEEITEKIKEEIIKKPKNKK